MEPVNPHLYFEPAIVAQGERVTFPAMLGLKPEDKERIWQILQDAKAETDTHTGTLSEISKRCATPQELMFLGFCYFEQIKMQDEVADQLTSAADLVGKAIAEALGRKMEAAEAEGDKG